MSLYTILSEKISQLPLKNYFSDSEDFKQYLVEVLNNYSQEVIKSELYYDSPERTIAVKPVFKDRIKKFIYAIELALESFYNDDSIKAFESFSEGLSTNLIFKYLKSMPGEIVVIPKDYNFFRIRKLKSSKAFNRKDLFHVPFEKKDRAANCRYSKSGTPALYLSNSLEFAFRETKIHNDFTAVRLENIDEIKIINVDFSYFLLSNLEKNFTEEPIRLEFLGMIWPLIASCSIKKLIDADEDKYQDEYIIPQLLMLYVINSKEFDGIRYFSTRIDSNNEKEYTNNYNLVLPTKSSKTNGYDENLCKLFKMTDSIEVKKDDISRAQSVLEQMIAYEIDF